MCIRLLVLDPKLCSKVLEALSDRGVVGFEPHIFGIKFKVFSTTTRSSWSLIASKHKLAL